MLTGLPQQWRTFVETMCDCVARVSSLELSRAESDVSLNFRWGARARNYKSEPLQNGNLNRFSQENAKLTDRQTDRQT